MDSGRPETNLEQSLVAGDSDDREVARRCGERVPAYMVPEKLWLTSGLPRTSTGKIDRRALLAQALAQDGPGGSEPTSGPGR